MNMSYSTTQMKIIVWPALDMVHIYSNGWLISWTNALAATFNFVASHCVASKCVASHCVANIFLHSPFKAWRISSGWQVTWWHFQLLLPVTNISKIKLTPRISGSDWFIIGEWIHNDYFTGKSCTFHTFMEINSNSTKLENFIQIITKNGPWILDWNSSLSVKLWNRNVQRKGTDLS